MIGGTSSGSPHYTFGVQRVTVLVTQFPGTHMFYKRALISFWCALMFAQPVAGGESDALAITANIKSRHLPFGTILDPIYTLTDSDTIASYTRCGDSALWTGHYLAAEAFRYKVTEAADALDNVRSAVAGLKALTDVTGTNLLARCLVPLSSPDAAGIAREEAANGVHTNSSYGSIWVGNTSRDQYAGAMFGLAVAFDMVSDSAIRSSISGLVTRLVDNLNGHNWSVTMPDESSSTTFLIRPDQIETFLAIGRRVNPDRFTGAGYETQRVVYSPSVPLPIRVDVAGDDSYFKFSLDYINLYNLIRLEGSSAKPIYELAYGVLRDHTALHENAFFNVIDLALRGPNPARDNQTMALLNGWLLRLRRDFGADLNGSVPVCGDRACAPVPVWRRPPTDFLWQRSPFQLSVGGAGIIEGAGIDYILPYWMARYYALRESIQIKSAASASSVVAPDSLGSVYGTSLASTTSQATSQPLPATLGGVTITVRDEAGTSRVAPLLYVSPGQINFLMPAGLTEGVATFAITTSTGELRNALGAVGRVAPALFSIDGRGSGVVAASALRFAAGSAPVGSPVELYQCSTQTCSALPIDVSAGSLVYLTVYGTGIRHRRSLDLDDVSVIVNGEFLPVLYAGAQPDFAGLDQINVQLPPWLAGTGLTNIVVKVNQHPANILTINIR
ncbi:MAG: hypothetical protein JWN34_4381 [Bryobacterales bacterium]|nr:hypothetical protein [Bryobacterales bacterium]